MLACVPYAAAHAVHVPKARNRLDDLHPRVPVTIGDFQPWLPARAVAQRQTRNA